MFASWAIFEGGYKFTTLSVAPKAKEVTRKEYGH